MKHKKKLRLKLRAEREQWRLDRVQYEGLIHGAKRHIENLKQRIVDLELAEIERQKAVQRKVGEDWALYDKAQAEVTAQEQALFEASPAYKRYQKYRAQRGGSVS